MRSKLIQRLGLDPADSVQTPSVMDMHLGYSKKVAQSWQKLSEDGTADSQLDLSGSSGRPGREKLRLGHRGPGVSVFKWP